MFLHVQQSFLLLSEHLALESSSSKSRHSFHPIVLADILVYPRFRVYQPSPLTHHCCVFSEQGEKMFLQTTRTCPTGAHSFPRASVPLANVFLVTCLYRLVR